MYFGRKNRLLLKFLNQMFRQLFSCSLATCERGEKMCKSRKKHYVFDSREEKSLLQFFFFCISLTEPKGLAEKSDSRHEKIRIFIVYAQKNSDYFLFFLWRIMHVRMIQLNNEADQSRTRPISNLSLTHFAVNIDESCKSSLISYPPKRVESFECFVEACSGVVDKTLKL